HLNRQPGPGKRTVTCEQCELYNDDTSKSLELLAQWLKHVA
ncbi:17668_t:CDS:1, partial [Funneliformis caledonium]